MPSPEPDAAIEETPARPLVLVVEDDQEIREAACDLPAAGAGALAEARRDGATATLAKPYDAAVLVGLLHRLGAAG